MGGVAGLTEGLPYFERPSVGLVAWSGDHAPTREARRKKAAGEAVPPSKLLTGRAPPRCAESGAGTAPAFPTPENALAKKLGSGISSFQHSAWDAGRPGKSTRH